jgi:hypothetical protein
VTLHRPVDLDVPAVPGGDEVGTDQQQDNASVFEMLADGSVPLRAGLDAAVVPAADDTLALQEA